MLRLKLELGEGVLRPGLWLRGRERLGREVGDGAKACAKLRGLWERGQRRLGAGGRLVWGAGGGC